MKSLGQLVSAWTEFSERLLEGLLTRKPSVLPKMDDIRVDPKPEYGGPIKTQVWGRDYDRDFRSEYLQKPMPPPRQLPSFFLEDEMPTKCGAMHPKYATVSCQRYGKCTYGTHRGILGQAPNARWVEWEEDPPQEEQRGYMSHFTDTNVGDD